MFILLNFNTLNSEQSLIVVETSQQKCAYFFIFDVVLSHFFLSLGSIILNLVVSVNNISMLECEHRVQLLMEILKKMSCLMQYEGVSVKQILTVLSLNYFNWTEYFVYP